jgi:hypothetical protein
MRGDVACLVGLVVPSVPRRRVAQQPGEGVVTMTMNEKEPRETSVDDALGAPEVAALHRRMALQAAMVFHRELDDLVYPELPDGEFPGDGSGQYWRYTEQWNSDLRVERAPSWVDEAVAHGKALARRINDVDGAVSFARPVGPTPVEGTISVERVTNEKVNISLLLVRRWRGDRIQNHLSVVAKKV